MNPNFLDRTIMRPFVAMVPKGLSPNAITAFRFICVPAVVYFLLAGNYKIGTLLFLIAAFSDAVDGAVARTRGETTKLGALFDPIADKLLIISTAIIMVVRFLPIWLFVLILITEFLIVSVALFGKYVKHLNVKANLFGKIKMILQCFGIASILLFSSFLENSVLISIAFYILIGSFVFAIMSLVYGIIKAKSGEIGL